MIELARKLNELAKQGIGGEKINAEKKLKEIMVKYHITITDIEGDEVRRFEFTVKDEAITLFSQIVCSVVLDYDGTFYRIRGKTKKKVIEMTYAEYVEVKAKFDIYSKDFEKQLQEHVRGFEMAYIVKNNLLSNISEKRQKEIDEIKDKGGGSNKAVDIASSLLITGTIEKKDYHKQIGGD